MTERKQVRPAAEGWTQAKDEAGKPLLQFAEPKRKQPPVHLADLSIVERAERVKELGIQGFRAKQLATHYFTHYTSNPADMTDLPAAGREELVGALLPPRCGRLLRRWPASGKPSAVCSGSGWRLLG